MRLLGGADAQLRVNGTPVQESGILQLLPGAQSIEIDLPTLPYAPLALEWQRLDHPEWKAVPRDQLFAVEPLGSGLLMKVFAGGSWQGGPIVARREMLIQAPSIPISPFSAEWTGFINVPATGSVGFRICSDDGSFLWIDDQVWVENGGSHGRECRESVRMLTAGRHALTLRYFQDGGAQTMELYWMLPGKPWEMVPADAFSPP